MPDFVRLREYIRRSGRKTALLNYLWSFMILAGLFWGMVTGSLEGVTQGLLDSAKDAVTLGLTMLGIMSFWSGILEVGNRAGVLDWLSGDHPALKPIAVNMTANMLGLGMAATPAGLEAMKKMKTAGERATDSMCTFLILNISSLQLVPITMVAYRAQYGSENPMAVLGPALAATACSTLAAVVFCKAMDVWRGKNL